MAHRFFPYGVLVLGLLRDGGWQLSEYQVAVGRRNSRRRTTEWAARAEELRRSDGVGGPCGRAAEERRGGRPVKICLVLPLLLHACVHCFFLGDRLLATG